MGYGLAAKLLMLIIGVATFVFAIFSIKKESRRIINGILLVIAFWFISVSIITLPNPYRYISRDMFYSGRDNLLFTLIFFICLGISIFGGASLCFNEIKQIINTKFSIINILPLFFGLSAMSWTIMFAVLFLRAEDSLTLIIISQTVLGIIAYVPIMLIVFLVYSVIYSYLKKDINCDFIIVLGTLLEDGIHASGMLAFRLEKAIDVFNKIGKRATFIVSGGKLNNAFVSEAFAMREYLLSRGISNEQIIMEPDSKNTYENLLFSKKIMQEVKPNFKSLLVTSNFHVLRAVILARSVGLDTHGIGSKTTVHRLPKAFFREYIAIIFKYKKLAISYISLIMLLNIILMIT